MQGSQLPQPHSHWMHMAPIKTMFHQRSLFHSYSLLRLRNCSLSFGRVWIQDPNREELVLNSPLEGSKKSPYVTITALG